jgi:hypothetical protein
LGWELGLGVLCDGGDHERSHDSIGQGDLELVSALEFPEVEEDSFALIGIDVTQDYG